MLTHFQNVFIVPWQGLLMMLQTNDLQFSKPAFSQRTNLNFVDDSEIWYQWHMLIWITLTNYITVNVTVFQTATGFETLLFPKVVQQHLGVYGTLSWLLNYKFIAEAVSETILTTDQHLATLWATLQLLHFLNSWSTHKTKIFHLLLLGQLLFAEQIQQAYRHHCNTDTMSNTEWTRQDTIMKARSKPANRLNSEWLHSCLASRLHLLAGLFRCYAPRWLQPGQFWPATSSHNLLSKT